MLFIGRARAAAALAQRAPRARAALSPECVSPARLLPHASHTREAGEDAAFFGPRATAQREGIRSLYLSLSHSRREVLSERERSLVERERESARACQRDSRALREPRLLVVFFTSGDLTRNTFRANARRCRDCGLTRRPTTGAICDPRWWLRVVETVSGFGLFESVLY